MYFANTTDREKIEYVYQQGHEEQERSAKSDEATRPSQKTQLSVVAPVIVPVKDISSTASVPLLEIPSGPAVLVIDVPLSASSIVLTITAEKLKRTFDNVPLQKSILELSGGNHVFYGVFQHID